MGVKKIIMYVIVTCLTINLLECVKLKKIMENQKKETLRQRLIDEDLHGSLTLEELNEMQSMRDEENEDDDEDMMFQMYQTQKNNDL